jgi:1,4-alpha-glucan branching enzyme
MSKKPVNNKRKPLDSKPAVDARTPKRAAPKTVNVRFALPEPNAMQVSLCGEFNGWSSEATPMKRRDDCHWEAAVDLAPGKYQYKFLVDGEWVPDPMAEESILNPHGTLNSVMEVQA